MRAAPENLIETRLALHRLAAYVIGPTRYASTERFGLRATEGGFGTPPFDGRQIRVHGTTLVDQVGDDVRSSPITTLAAAAGFLGSTVVEDVAAEHDTPAAGDHHAELNIDEDASNFLGEWFAMAFAALTAVAADEASVDASEPQLWPGHFDPAIEVGDEDHRGSYGASPGDDAIAEPYLYVSLWWPDRLSLDLSDPAWNAPSFTGSVLRLSDFPDDVDAVEAAIGFWRTTRDRVMA